MSKVALEEGERFGNIGRCAIDYLSLIKPRIVFLLVFSCFSAMMVAHHGFPNSWTTVFTALGLALSAGGANAINMWYDRDIDAVMERTKNRPLPAERLPARNALIFGITLESISIALLLLTAGLWATFFSTLGFFYYVFLYTMWLKRRTPQNIVIGRAAGAFPPLVGWAAMTGGIAVAPWIMFLIVFLWTPAHFWSLAISKKEEYRKARVPMLPVALGERAARRQSLLYNLLLLPVSVALFFTGAVGKVYLVAAFLLGIGFIFMSVKLIFEQARSSSVWAERTFHYSIFYLTALFTVMLADIR
ncbi:MAG: protoheme IX farnesyltransferase [Firmicutes bacterium]|nr:protoheme IX farnesyltransferase [Bacillota bacterium]